MYFQASVMKIVNFGDSFFDVKITPANLCASFVTQSSTCIWFFWQTRFSLLLSVKLSPKAGNKTKPHQNRRRHGLDLVFPSLNLFVHATQPTPISASVNHKLQLL